MLRKLSTRVFEVIFRVFLRLTQPLTPDLSTEDRFHVHAVSGIMLALLLFALPAFTMVSIFSPSWENAFTLNVLLRALTVVMIAVFYIMARRGHHRMVSVAAIILITPVIASTSLLAVYPRNLMVLHFMTVAAIYAIVLMSARVVLINCLLQIIVLLALPLVSEMTLYDIFAGPLTFNIVASFMVMGVQHLRRKVREIQKIKLAESENRYRIVSELISDYAYSFRVEPDGTLVNEWMTESFARVTGYGWDEIKDRGITPVTHPDDVEEVRQGLERVLKGEANTSEYRITTKKGDLRWIKVHRRPEWDADHTRVVRFYGVAKDVTEARLAREQQTRHEVDNARMAVIDQFVSAISHDFRTSLATIETSRYLVERRLPEDLRQSLANKLNAIQNNIQRLNSQLDNLQTITSLNALKFAPVDVNALVQNLLYEMQSLQKEVKISLRATSGLPQVMADNREVQRALRQLLDNALAFTPEDGTIIVRTGQCMEYVIIEVADMGPGIAEEHLPHIFDMFYRGDEARSINKGGIGLGLSIAKMAMEAHNGKICVRSNPGGSTFTLELPFAQRAETPVSTWQTL